MYMPGGTGSKQPWEPLYGRNVRRCLLLRECLPPSRSNFTSLLSPSTDGLRSEWRGGLASNAQAPAPTGSGPRYQFPALRPLRCHLVPASSSGVVTFLAGSLRPPAGPVPLDFLLSIAYSSRCRLCTCRRQGAAARVPATEVVIAGFCCLAVWIKPRGNEVSGERLYWRHVPRELALPDSPPLPRVFGTQPAASCSVSCILAWQHPARHLPLCSRAARCCCRMRQD